MIFNILHVIIIVCICYIIKLSYRILYCILLKCTYVQYVLINNDTNNYIYYERKYNNMKENEVKGFTLQRSK
jgi:hypothetical protein